MTRVAWVSGFVASVELHTTGVIDFWLSTHVTPGSVYTRPMPENDKVLRRRDWLGNCIAKGALLAGVPMASTQLFALWQSGEQKALKPTPAEVLGPFFRKGAPNTARLHKPGDPGFALRVLGRVLNTRGEKVPGAQIDVWHADHAGLYDVQGYRYRAKIAVGDSSEYTLETIMPGHYPDRPAQHIHYMISAPGHQTLITQAYFATDPYFEGDPEKNYGKRGIVSSRELVRPVKLYEQGNVRAEIGFDIILEKA
jgi:protocatechuate 3,4-dioxygenase beta subunit